MSDFNHNLTVLDPPAQARTVQTGTSPAKHDPQPPQERWAAWLYRTGPTFLVVLVLAGIGWWGHHTGWKLSKFSDLFGGAQTAPDDWCDEHAVPEEICIECNRDLVPPQKDYGFCRVHGVHNCPFEHPDVAQTPGPATVLPEDLESAKRALALKPRVENNPKCKLYHRRIQFASDEALAKMGVDIALVTRGPVEETITVSGEVTFADPNVAPVHTNVTGRVYQLTDLALLGATVKKGDVLALVDAVDVGKAKAEFLQAFALVDLKAKTLERLRPLLGTAVPEGQFREAEAAWQEAKIRLLAAQHALTNLGLPINASSLEGKSMDEVTSRVHYLGLPHDMLKTFDASTPSGNLIPVRAPRDGIITSAKVVAKETVDPSKPLFVVADTSVMWLKLNVRQEDLKFLKIRDAAKGTPGQTVRFRPDGATEDVTGELVWLTKSVDDRTRTVQVRADLPNSDGKLLANTFGTGQIILRKEDNAILVPSEAVHWEGDCNVVFVRDKNFLEPDAYKFFHVRSVRVGVKNGPVIYGVPHTEVIAGVLEGEVVAGRNSTALRGELLKNRLGEG